MKFDTPKAQEILDSIVDLKHNDITLTNLIELRKLEQMEKQTQYLSRIEAKLDAIRDYMRTM